MHPVNHLEETLPNLKARKHQMVREMIWDAAIDLFFRKGFDETTVDEIAQAAGMSTRTFFRYFQLKGDLMAYTLAAYGESLATAIEDYPTGYSPREAMRAAVLRVAEAGVADPRAKRVMEILRQSPAARAAQLSCFSEVQDRVGRALARHMPADTEDRLAAGILAGMALQLTGATIRLCHERGDTSIAKALDSVLATLEAAICRSNRFI